MVNPCGKRILAGDSPGGVVVVWDVESGRDIRTIETGNTTAAREDDYVFLAPDWQTVFVSRSGKNKFEQFGESGKRLFHWQFDGAVRAWDLTTGQLRRTFEHQPGRYIMGMELSPDGRKFVTFERPPGTFEGRPRWAVSLCDVATGQYRPLADDLQSNKARFAPDGALVAMEGYEYDGSRTLRLFDTATGQEKKSFLPERDKNAWLSVSAFSPDGRLVMGDYRLFNSVKRDNWQCWLKWWDVATGREIGSFAEEKNSFDVCCFSADGQTLAVTNWRSEETKLHLFRSSDHQPAKTLIVEKKPKGQCVVVRTPIFSRDSKWIALTQMFPDNIRRGDFDVQDVPQPRIHLIDAAAGAIRETVVAPQGIALSACFSPDGKTLATSGHGRVLLWDLTKLPGAANSAHPPFPALARWTGDFFRRRKAHRSTSFATRLVQPKVKGQVWQRDRSTSVHAYSDARHPTINYGVGQISRRFTH